MLAQMLLCIFQTGLLLLMAPVPMMITGLSSTSGHVIPRVLQLV